MSSLENAGLSARRTTDGERIVFRTQGSRMGPVTRRLRAG